MKSNIILFILAFLLSTSLSLEAQTETGTTTIVKRVISADGIVNEETILLQGDQMDEYLRNIETEHNGALSIEVEKENENTVINIIIDESVTEVGSNGSSKKEIKVYQFENGEGTQGGENEVTVDVQEMNGQKVITIVKDGEKKVIEVEAGEKYEYEEDGNKVVIITTDEDHPIDGNNKEVSVDVQEMDGHRIVTIVKDGVTKMVKVEGDDSFELEEDGHNIIVLTEDEKGTTAPKAFIGIQMDQRIEKTNDGQGEVTDKSAIKVISTIINSPAEKAGVQTNDIIKAIDGKELSEMDELLNQLDGKSVGDEIVLSVLRGGIEKNITIVLGERPKEQMFMHGGKPGKDIKHKPHTSQHKWTPRKRVKRDPCKPFIGVQTNRNSRAENQGLAILRVVENTAADRANLKKGDIIIQMDGEDVNSMKELRTLRDAHEAGDRFKLVVLRDGKRKKIKANFNDCDVKSDMEIKNIQSDREDVKNLDLSVFPNPSAGEINIAYKGTPGNMRLKIMDMITGKIIIEQESNEFDGVYNNSFDFSDKQTGSLIVQIENEGQRHVEKIIIQHLY